jgi:phenylacetate-coenzyme A ligase PaaK-like adenylate-forming protein
MAIDFRMRDFAYPLSILTLKKIFDKNQWMSEEELYEYQSAKLKQIISHAYRNVPYYHKLFKKNSIIPSDIQTAKDLKHIPYLTKDLLRNNFASLVACNARQYKPTLLSTSGTTGGKVSFYVDKPSNILEFVYYWRLWNCAGYKLGNTFATLSSEDFIYMNKHRNAKYYFNSFTRKLTMNSMLISRTYLGELTGILRKFKPLFLKAHPLNLYLLALVFNGKRDHGISFKGIFSQGADLLPYQRDLIGKVFSCQIFDCYGQMERTVAIPQCPSGMYHIHLDYGIAELEEPGIPLVNQNDEDTGIKEIVGTSLYNFSMPLIRYRIGDFVKLKRSPEKCSCGRGFPTIDSVIGGEQDLVVAHDGRQIAGISSVFSHTPGIILGQIIQEKINQLLVKIVCATEDTENIDRILLGHMKNFMGDDTDIKIEHTTIEGIRKDKFGKFKTVVSNVRYENIPG